MMAKIVEANRSLLHVTSVMARAALKGDREAFQIAQQQAEETLELCDSYVLAVASAVDAFADVAHPGHEGARREGNSMCAPSSNPESMSSGVQASTTANRCNADPSAMHPLGRCPPGPAGSSLRP